MLAGVDAEGPAVGELDATGLVPGTDGLSLAADGEPAATEHPATRPARASEAPTLQMRPSLV
jgi:hypothetical protein